MKYFCSILPNKTRRFLQYENRIWHRGIFKQEEGFFREPPSLKTGQDWTEVAVLSEDNEGAYAVIGGYIADIWEGANM